jgi:phospholipid transport system substrate-binding protein
MRFLKISLAALALGVAGTSGIAAAPAFAQTAATPADAKAAGVFVDTLADRAFGVLRDKSLSKPAARAKFRSMLRENFAVNEIGTKLIRRHRANLTPAQYNAYLEVFPDFVVGTYADRLYDYANADLRITRVVPAGTRGDINVGSRITLSSGGQPIDSVWSVKRDASGKFVIQNLTVAGVNLALTQEADFTSYIQRNGFDALLKFMRDAANKA